jgi:hypothetical protein
MASASLHCRVNTPCLIFPGERTASKKFGDLTFGWTDLAAVAHGHGLSGNEQEINRIPLSPLAPSSQKSVQIRFTLITASSGRAISVMSYVLRTRRDWRRAVPNYSSRVSKQL